MRFHVHLHVNNLEANIAFYSKLFACEPVRVEVDYAKWMLEHPGVNFAISTRGNATGVDHLGLQADEPEEKNIGLPTPKALLGSIFIHWKAFQYSVRARSMVLPATKSAVLRRIQ
jgi:catechol 2,3-dioxygenase-like lactoylglutathione lyase family enzyme